MERRLQAVIEDLRLGDTLRGFDPRVVGTIPLGIDVPGSDVDVVCQALDLDRWLEVVTASFGDRPGFRCGRLEVRGVPSAVASFEAGLPVELVAQPVPVDEQHGWRHFVIQRRLLRERPGLREEVMVHRARGLKTEPAFAAALGLEGDPYLALLELESGG